MNLDQITEALKRITKLRLHLMYLTEAYETGTPCAKPAVAHAIGICAIELRAEIDMYLDPLAAPTASDIVDGHEIRTMQ